MLGSFVFDDVRDLSVTQLVHASHDLGLVSLSLAVAFISCYAAFQMAQTNRQAAALSHRRVSLLCASMVLGLGIWAMHFIGMLAMHLPTPVAYDTLGTAFSILPGIASAWLALLFLQTHKSTTTRILGSGFLVGIGIAAMHYSGIAAMQLDGRILFHAPMFVVSALAGILLATLALVAQRWVRKHPSHSAQWYWGLLPAATMTLAIACMHYLSMHALRVQLLDPQAQLLAHLPHISSRNAMSFAVAAMTGVVFLVFGLVNALLRYRDMWQAVAARDARLNAMVDAADDGFISIDAKGTVQDFNTSAERIFGYRKDEVIGRNISMLMPSPLAEQHDGHLERHVGHPTKAISVNGREVLGKHKDGRHVPLQLAIGKAITPAGTIFVGYLQDISARKRTDAQLRIAASVFHHVREGVAIVDANHNISDVNPAFLQLFEMSKTQCVGKSLESLYEHVDAPPDMSKLWNTVAAKQYWQSEVAFTRNDGKVWIQRLSISPVLSEQQRPHHFIAVISDVSPRQGWDVPQSPAEWQDSATGLPTYALFTERLSDSLVSAQRQSVHVGVVIFKLLPFKTPATQPSAANHDGALVLLAQLLQRELRTTETLARSGKDQLVVLLPAIKDGQAFKLLLQRLRHTAPRAHTDMQGLGIESLHIGHASTLLSSFSANELIDDARAALQAIDVPLDSRTH